MKEKSLYFVEDITADWDKYFLVKAFNQKEAIDIVFIKHFQWQNTRKLKEKGYRFFYKKDLVATRVDKLFKDSKDDYVSLD